MDEKKKNGGKKAGKAGREKEMKTFEVKGKFLEKGKEKKFSKTVSALSHGLAAEKTMALIGSTNRIKRRNIFIEEAREGEKENDGKKE